MRRRQACRLTGLNVLDAFPARDLAQGGLGGPLLALAEWLLLRPPDCNRVLLDLGRTAALRYLPAAILRPRRRQDSLLRGRSRHGDAGPAGPAALQRRTRLRSRWPHGRARTPPGRADRAVAIGSRLSAPLPRWHPRGVRPERFLTDALQMAVE